MIVCCVCQQEFDETYASVCCGPLESPLVLTSSSKSYA